MFNTPNYNNYPWMNYGMPQQQQIPPQAQSNGINWVQGEAGAKSYAIAPNQSVLLMDAENNVFYIKSSDASGMPLPLRTFEYMERVATPQQRYDVSQQQQAPDYITRREFEKRLAEVTNAKQHIPTTNKQQQ